MNLKAGSAPLPAYAAPTEAGAPPKIAAGAAEVTRGEALFASNCSACLGPRASGNGVVPDLRRSPAIGVPDSFRAIVHGALAGQGMPDFSKWLTAQDVEAIRAYVVVQAEKTESAAERSHSSNAVHQ